MTNGLTNIGFTDNEKDSLFKILAGILHLGNIEFEENFNDKIGKHFFILFTISNKKKFIYYYFFFNLGEIFIKKVSEESLKLAAEFLGLNVTQLSLGLTTRSMQPTNNKIKDNIIV